jgi:hypothetical protein
VVQDYGLSRGFSTDFTCGSGGGSDVNADDEVRHIQINIGLYNIYCKCIDRQSPGHQEHCKSVFQYAVTLLHAGIRGRMKLRFHTPSAGFCFRIRHRVSSNASIHTRHTNTCASVFCPLTSPHPSISFLLCSSLLFLFTRHPQIYTRCLPAPCRPYRNSGPSEPRRLCPRTLPPPCLSGLHQRGRHGAQRPCRGGK